MSFDLLALDLQALELLGPPAPLVPGGRAAVGQPRLVEQRLVVVEDRRRTGQRQPPELVLEHALGQQLLVVGRTLQPRAEVAVQRLQQVVEVEVVPVDLGEGDQIRDLLGLHRGRDLLRRLVVAALELGLHVHVGLRLVEPLRQLGDRHAGIPRVRVPDHDAGALGVLVRDLVAGRLGEAVAAAATTAAPGGGEGECRTAGRGQQRASAQPGRSNHAVLRFRSRVEYAVVSNVEDGAGSGLSPWWRLE